MEDISILEEAEENFADERKDKLRILEIANKLEGVLEDTIKLNDVYVADNQKLEARTKNMCTSFV